MTELACMIPAEKNRLKGKDVIRGLAVALALAVSVAVSACGGGGEASPSSASRNSSPNPTSTTTAQPSHANPSSTAKAIQVRMYGDSTMFGLEYVNGTPQGTDGIYIGTKNNVPAVLSELLQSDIGPTVAASGVASSGATIRDAVLGQHGFAAPLAQALANDPSQIVVENFGINDSIQYSPDEFRQYLIEFVTIAQSAGKMVVLETPQPTCNLANDQLWVAPTASIVVEVAAQMGLSVIDQYSHIQAIPNWCATYMGDGTHPKNDQLYALKAQYEVPVVASVVKILMSVPRN